MTGVAAGDDVETSATQTPGRVTTIGTAVHLLTLAWAVGIASFPLNDNSFFTHLATGRLILERGSVPTSDPYTFTAPDAAWTVQSWLASVVYAVFERMAGALGLRLLLVLLLLSAAELLWRVTAQAQTLTARAAIVVGALLVGTDLWTARPYMVGVIGLGVVWLALAGRVRPEVLVALFWLWGNSHGSFPLGLLLVATVWSGRRLDGDDAALEARVFRWSAVGSVVAIVGPLGLRAITFPLTAATRSDLFSEIVEWQPPAFVSTGERAFLLLAIFAIVGLVRYPRWSAALPLAVFTAAAVVAQRNVVMATVVLAGVCAASWSDAGWVSTRARPSLVSAYNGFAALTLVAALLFAGISPVVAFGGYPALPLALLYEEGSVGSYGNLAAQDFTGNLIGLLEGPTEAVFVDDRADMFPRTVFEDDVALVRGRPGWEGILDRYDIELVLWERRLPLASLLATSDDWQTVYADSRWQVSCRRSNGSCAPFGR